MFSEFYVELDKTIFDEKCILDYRNKWLERYCQGKQSYDESLKRYMCEEKISASLLEKDWFPDVDVDVFLSHSHEDQEIVEAFAGWLYETFNIRCFIDSDAWNYVGSLIRLLNQKYSNPSPVGKTTYYSYENANKVSEHANMILALALQKMIDRAETVFLVNAGSAVHFTKENIENETYSPWIYAESVFANMIRKKSLIEYRSYKSTLCEQVQKNEDAVLEAILVSYPVNLLGIEKLNVSRLREWRHNYLSFPNDFQYPLDALYQITKYASAFERTQQLANHLTDNQLSIVKKCNSPVVENANKEFKALMESVNESFQSRYGECPFYGGCIFCHRHKFD